MAVKGSANLTKLVAASTAKQPGAASSRSGLLRLARSDNGFTLVELMVVLALIALAATAVVLTLPSANGGALAEATRFAARVASLRDRSVIEGRTHGLWVTASGYGFERRREAVWQPLDDGRLSRADWRAGTAVTVDGAPQGRLSFNRVGLPDRPMRVDFRAGDSAAGVVIDAAGEVAVR